MTQLLDKLIDEGGGVAIGQVVFRPGNSAVLGEIRKVRAIAGLYEMKGQAEANGRRITVSQYFEADAVQMFVPVDMPRPETQLITPGRA